MVVLVLGYALELAGRLTGISEGAHRISNFSVSFLSYKWLF
jgi:hypothetical protein